MSYTDLGSLLIACAAAGWLILPRFVAPRATGRSRPACGPLMILARDPARYAMIGILADARGPAPVARPAPVIARVTATEVLWRRKGWE
ncbi:MAG: hypothetical protein AAF501_00580 [Pseudomonadota bacterium]